MFGAVSQAEFLAAFSSDASLQRPPVGVFCPGSPMANDAGLADLPPRADSRPPKLRWSGRVWWREGGGAGASDHPVNSVMAMVGAELMKRLGLNVDFRDMDAGTMFQRRANREGADKGGWSVFPSSVAGIDVFNPVVSFLARGDGQGRGMAGRPPPARPAACRPG